MFYKKIMLVFLFTLVTSNLFALFNKQNKDAIPDLSYKNIKFDEIKFYDGKMKVLLPDNPDIRKNRHDKKYGFYLAMTEPDYPTVGRVPTSMIYVNSDKSYKNTGQYFYTKVYEQTVISREEHPYFSKSYRLILKDKSDKTLVIKVGAYFSAEQRNKGYYEKRLSENRKIFDHIKKSLRIQTEDGKYVKPEIIKLKDKIYDKTEEAQKHKKLSSDEFDKMLYSWDEKKVSQKQFDEKVAKATKQRYEAYLKSLGYDLDKIEYVM